MTTNPVARRLLADLAEQLSQPETERRRSPASAASYLRHWVRTHPIFEPRLAELTRALLTGEGYLHVQHDVPRVAWSRYRCVRWPKLEGIPMLTIVDVPDKVPSPDPPNLVHVDGVRVAAAGWRVKHCAGCDVATWPTPDVADELGDAHAATEAPASAETLRTCSIRCHSLMDV